MPIDWTDNATDVFGKGLLETLVSHKALHLSDMTSGSKFLTSGSNSFPCPSIIAIPFHF